MKHALFLGFTALTALCLTNGAAAQAGRAPSSSLRYNTAIENAGDGYLTGADLWNTIKPPNSTEASRLGSPYANVAGGVVNRMLFGSRANWQEPGGQWPAGYHWTNTFRNSHFMFFPVFKATGWPGYGPGNPVRAIDPSNDTKGAGGTSRFMWAAYGPNVPGASDANRNYKRPARYVDAGRTHLVYEAGWPTTAGIDFKVRTHQFTPNEQNLNDFTVVEITMTNTGIVDSNADGTPEATNNVVDGASMILDATPSPTIEISVAGDRGCNCIAAGRTWGYIAAPDATGAPYDLFAWYANTPPTGTTGRATPAIRAFGIDNTNQLLGYSDIWNAWTFLGVKQGGISNTDLGAIRSSTPDKTTVFGTPGVGTGARRGWYNSVQWQNALTGAAPTSSALGFRASTATWYADYGKTTNGSTLPPNLAPNPAFFSGGTADDITTFTVGNANARPNGDFKYASEDVSKAIGISQPVWEPMWNPGAASGTFYDGAVGFTKEYTFGEAVSAGNGPYRLAVGESITIVWTALAGYRMEGVVDASKAARWAWDRGWNTDTDLPVPAAPDMNVESTTQGTAMVRWTDVANAVPGRPITGYKIWRSSQYKRTKYLDKGMRLVDRYHEQHTIGEPAAALYDAVNPNFNAQSLFKGDIQGTYQPAEWGTYDLVAKIPAGELGQYAANAANGYQYGYEDKDAITGFTYWYYVAAYRDGNFTGPLGRTATHLESARINWNGRNGRSTTPGGATATPNGTISLDSPWGGTYPWATVNALFPKAGTQALKNIGAQFTVTPATAAVADVERLITVSPNPYKITGLNDVRSDPASHTINFLNLPAAYTLTILDVTGQVIFQRKETAAVNGRYSWDLFSKDGVEVASGLYLYHVSYDYANAATNDFTGPRKDVTGYFSILR